MALKKHVLIGIILLNLFSTVVFSQLSKVDSLIKLTKTAKLHDTTKLKLYGDISWELLVVDLNEAFNYAGMELKLAKQLNRKADIAQAESDIAAIYSHRGFADSAILHYNEALAIRKILKQDDKVAGIIFNISSQLERQSKYSEAIAKTFEALKVFEKLKDSTKQAMVLSQIGTLYYDLKQDDNAIIFLRKALYLAKKCRSIKTEANVLNALGGVKFHVGLVNEKIASKIDLDSAIYFFTEAEKILVPINAVYNLSAIYNNLGRIYAEYLIDYKKAITYYQKSLEIKTQLNDENGIGNCYINLGVVYKLTLDYKKSEEFLQKSIPIFLAAKNYSSLRQSYGELSELYEAKQDYKNAMAFHQLYAQYSDSIYTKETAEQFAEMQTKYETEKKDFELLKNKTEIEFQQNQNTLKNIIIASVCFVGLLGALLVNARFKRIKELNKSIANKTIFETEQNERTRIARDLHDSVGQMLAYIKMENNQDANAPISKAIDKTIEEVRSISHELMPAELVFGLPNALEALINGTKLLAKININTAFQNAKFNSTFSITLYRIMQELVNNTLKHALASKIELMVEKVDEQINIQFFTDGKEINLTNLQNSKGIGWQNINARLLLLNGNIKIENSTQQNGFVLNLYLPNDN